MMTIRKDHASPPAPVAQSWRRIEAWLGEHLPIFKLSLRPGISGTDLERFEKTVGRSLPDDVRESWMIHDGQRPVPYLPDAVEYSVEDDDDLLSKGVVFGSVVLPLLDEKDCLASSPSSGTGRSGRRWSGRRNVARTTGCSTSSARRARPPRRGRSSGSTPAEPGYHWSR